MVTDYVTPMDQAYALLGKPKISLEQGVQETLTWLRTPTRILPHHLTPLPLRRTVGQLANCPTITSRSNTAPGPTPGIF